MTRFRSLSVSALLAGLVALLASCAQPAKTICPRIAVLNQASKLIKFAPGAGQQPGDVMYAVEMTGAKINCTYSGALYTEMESNVSATITARKGPRMQGETAKLTYFIVVTDRRGTVLTKKQFPVTINFRGRPAVQLVEASWQLYNLSKGGNGAQYETWLGFQLSDAELQFNRSAPTQ